MTAAKLILLYYLLPIVAWLSYPPTLLLINPSMTTFRLLGLVIILFIILGIFLQKGRTTALTLAIFLQGLNVIIRLMMLFPNAFNKNDLTLNWPYIFFNLLGMGISFYLMLRLDRSDIRVSMVA
jgi:hypothetical protein